MPWESTTMTSEKVRFVRMHEKLVARGRMSMSALCAEFGIARKTGYKMLERQRRHGYAGLEDRSRAPKSGGHWTDPELCQAILVTREEFPYWGARKIIAYLEDLDPLGEWPSASAAHEMLRKAGLVPGQKRQRRWPHPGPPGVCPIQRPNQLWTTDFKGEFRTGDGRYCYPLTVADAYSRYLLACKGLVSTSFEQSWPVFKRLFREYGLPESMRSDNGPPFASRAIGRLSRLSVRWIRLGIRPDLIEPASPYQNGRHERMHKTLKQQTTRPAGLNLIGQQHQFDRFRREYNQVRPHESLGQKPPAYLYAPSPRPYPERLPEPDYPDHAQKRRVRSNGEIKWQGELLFVSEVLIGETVAFEQLTDDTWLLYFGPLVLGQYCERRRQLVPDKDPA